MPGKRFQYSAGAPEIFFKCGGRHPGNSLVPVAVGSHLMPRRRDAPDDLGILFRNGSEHEERAAALAFVADIEEAIGYPFHPARRASQPRRHSAFVIDPMPLFHIEGQKIGNAVRPEIALIAENHARSRAPELAFHGRLSCDAMSRGGGLTRPDPAVMKASTVTYAPKASRLFVPNAVTVMV